ncbi:MAG: hypothetical protein JNM56_30765 [Planctomycetia bacterium]|nr:hypothetical protein [Planctomycetia bacterium]
MNAVQRQFLVIGGLLALLLAPYFNPLLDSAERRIDGLKNPPGAPARACIRVFCPRTSTRKPFLLIAYVKSPYPEQSITLHLPPGLYLLAGQSFTQSLPPPGAGGYSQVVWRVRAVSEGDFTVEVVAPGIGAAVECIPVWNSICAWGL